MQLFFFLMANIGTTIAPWMLFFQQSSVVDKGLKEKDIAWGKFDTFIGAIFTVLVAVFIVIVAGTVLNGQDINDAAQASEKLMETHHYAGVFMAIGLFDAGLLGAICISLASSWAFGEVFGWAHSLNNKIREAPLFYVSYFFALITAGLVVLIPRAPLVLITLFVQVIAVTLLPAALVFLILLLNDRKTHGRALQHTRPEPCWRLYRRLDRGAVDPLRHHRDVPQPDPLGGDRHMNAIRNFFAKIGDVNRRYREPRIEMSGAVRLSLMALRVYLLALVALMVYKFVLLLTQG